jgi:hypothetical protein
MKSIITKMLLCVSLITISCIAPQKTTAQISISFQNFYDDLSPYGTWIYTQEYGYVWMPDVDESFMPYNTNGYWMYTNAGWTWVSNYAWGWAPFHYGRWYYDEEYGNMWIPGNEWGPGWVSWRQSDDYYGWAPLGPGISIELAFGNSYNIPFNRWTFVRNSGFGRTNINRYYMNRSNNNNIYNNTTVINNMQINRDNNVRYNGGPDRTQVQERTGRTVREIRVSDNNKPGQQVSNSEYKVYRPRVEQNNDAAQKPAPQKVRDIKEMRTMNNKKDGIPAQQNNAPKSVQQARDQQQEQADRKKQEQQQTERKQQQQQPKQQPAPQQKNQPVWPQQRQQPIPQRQPEKQPQQKQPERQQPQPQQKQQPQQPQQRQPNKQPERQQPQQQRQPEKQQPQPSQQKQPERQQPQQQRQPNKQPERQAPQQKQPEQNKQPSKEKPDNNPRRKG